MLVDIGFSPTGRRRRRTVACSRVPIIIWSVSGAAAKEETECPPGEYSCGGKDLEKRCIKYELVCNKVRPVIVVGSLYHKGIKLI